MCLITIFWQQSYLLITNDWIDAVIALQHIILEEFEYYGIYEPSLINATVSLFLFKSIEHLMEITFKLIFFQAKTKL